MMMLSLGDFQFGVDTAAYAELSLKTEYPWAKVDRLQNTPQHQVMGLEVRSVSLRGTVYPSYRGAGAVADRDPAGGRSRDEAPAPHGRERTLPRSLGREEHLADRHHLLRGRRRGKTGVYDGNREVRLLEE